ncbi:PREDICTED: uncharacterized protein LOC106745431 [Dinoponera quadriceps]|uniref:Uncharacterized protein LOC106745431 n=1 Tax=Dinoponera quadriceps TaxID=609295 RepID=A0A6P3XF64_DINQU|nr:PREDICTED: uncharacterized protein LOC106745431 [Dinoponera quadriceps]
MDPWTIVLSILVFLLVIYYFSSPESTQNVFRQHGIPHGRRVSVLQELLELFVFPKTYTEMIQAAYNIHPDSKYIGIFHLRQRKYTLARVYLRAFSC